VTGALRAWRGTVPRLAPGAFLALAIGAAAGLAAQEVPTGGREGLSVSLGPDAGLVSLTGLAYGGLLDTGYQFGAFRTGILASMTYNPEGQLTGQVFLGSFRWNMFNLKKADIWIEANIGALSIERGGDLDPVNSRGWFAGGLRLGCRWYIVNNWYLEPFIAGGYPYLALAGFVGGIHFQAKRRVIEIEKIVEVEKPVEVEKIVEVEVPVEVEKIVTVEVPVEVEKIVTVEVPVEVEKIVEVEVPVEVEKIVEVEKVVEAAPPIVIDNYVIYFDPDSARLTDPEAPKVFTRIAESLQQNPEYSIVVDGNANPVLRSGAETPVLYSLGKRRALRVLDALKKDYGIDERKVAVVASGGLKQKAARSDPNKRTNRRVDIQVIKGADSVMPRGVYIFESYQ
jgi:outer membrane protein OmpA-like peptidoglycan-associated protein